MAYYYLLLFLYLQERIQNFEKGGGPMRIWLASPNLYLFV